MKALPRAIQSNQQGPHRGLVDIVRKHLVTTWQRPLRAHNKAAFARLAPCLDDRPLVLDWGCGVAESTRFLAKAHPDCLVIGVDRSQARLARAGVAEPVHVDGNLILIRADVEDIAILMVREGRRALQQWFLYPNPYPKADHLKRRWHAHPVWPTLLALGGELELRTNFEIYAQEMALALAESGIAAQLTRWLPDPALTPFERKYAAAGQSLWRLAATLPVPAG